MLSPEVPVRPASLKAYSPWTCRQRGRSESSPSSIYSTVETQSGSGAQASLETPAVNKALPKLTAKRCSSSGGLAHRRGTPSSSRTTCLRCKKIRAIRTGAEPARPCKAVTGSLRTKLAYRSTVGIAVSGSCTSDAVAVLSLALARTPVAKAIASSGTSRNVAALAELRSAWDTRGTRVRASGSASTSGISPRRSASRTTASPAARCGAARAGVAGHGSARVIASRTSASVA
jgi:hypothetical protein